MKKLSNAGSTLVEMLVVIVVLAILGVLVVTIFTRTLRGTNKTQIISSIKQNGQSILETMNNSIRNADNIFCISQDHHTIVVVKNGLYTRYRFVIDSSGLSNGKVSSDNPQQLGVESSIFMSNICNSADLLVAPQTLSDTNTQTGVNLISGSFTKTAQAGFKDIITIEFVLRSGVQAPAAVAGQIEPVTFKTTIEPR